MYQMAVPEFTYGWSMIPYEITTGEDLIEPVIVEAGNETFEVPQQPGPPLIYLTLFTSMFMHGGIGHIVGNMLYLWIFGDNVEHRFGHFWFFIFYLISGLVASFAQIMLTPEGVIPNLGASGVSLESSALTWFCFRVTRLMRLCFTLSSRYRPFS